MGKFVLGVAVGMILVCGFLAFGPAGTEAQAKASGAAVVETAEDVKFSYCQKTFLAETSCFQKLSSAQCVAMIDAKCRH